MQSEFWEQFYELEPAAIAVFDEEVAPPHPMNRFLGDFADPQDSLVAAVFASRWVVLTYLLSMSRNACATSTIAMPA